MKKNLLGLAVAGVMMCVSPMVPLAQAQDSAPSLVQGALPDFSALVQEVGAAVVNISVVKKLPAGAAMPGFPGMSPDDPFYDLMRRFGFPVPGHPGFPGGGGAPQISQGIGSGFIISADGYVLTNAHVVGTTPGADTEVTVTLNDKREMKAKIVGVDERTDVAVLKIDGKDLPVVRMGDPNKVRVGQWVVAVGSPFGFENTVTAGIVSAKARRLPSETYVPFIQTDVAINPGNSGGPLFNLAGEVIGINSQIYSRSGGFMGISFAIPIDVALKVERQLVAHGSVQRGKLGITIQSLTQELAQNFGLKQPTGALVSSVEAGSAGERAGIQPGDVVLDVDGETVNDSGDLPRIIGEKQPGAKVRVKLWRDGAEKTVDATLDRMQSSKQPAAAQSPNEASNDKLGVSARALTQDEARRLNLKPGQGVLVQSADGAAARAGIRNGDVLLAVNNQPVDSVATLRRLVDAAGKQFALLVQRGDEGRIFVAVKLN